MAIADKQPNVPWHAVVVFSVAASRLKLEFETTTKPHTCLFLQKHVVTCNIHISSVQLARTACTHDNYTQRQQQKKGWATHGQLQSQPPVAG